MKRIIAAGSIAALAMVGLAGTASAKPASDPRPVAGGIACQQFGLGVLRATGALPMVAKEGLAFPIGSDTVYSLSQVLAIHRTSPATANVVLKAYAPVLLPDLTDEQLADLVEAVDAACPTS